MAGAWVHVHGLVPVVLGAVVLVGDGQQDGRAQSSAVLGARVDGHAVLLVAGRRDGRLARAAAVELGLDVILGEGEVGRAVFDDARDGPAVRLAGTGEIGYRYVLGRSDAISQECPNWQSRQGLTSSRESGGRKSTS